MQKRSSSQHISERHTLYVKESHVPRVPLFDHPWYMQLRSAGVFFPLLLTGSHYGVIRRQMLGVTMPVSVVDEWMDT